MGILQEFRAFEEVSYTTDALPGDNTIISEGSFLE